MRNPAGQARARGGCGTASRTDPLTTARRLPGRVLGDCEMSDTNKQLELEALTAVGDIVNFHLPAARRPLASRVATHDAPLARKRERGWG